LNELNNLIEKKASKDEVTHVRVEITQKVNQTLPPLKEDYDKLTEYQKKARISMDNTDLLEAAAYQKLQEVMRIKKVNEELLEYLSSSLRYILHYSKKNNIILPHIDKIKQIIDRAIATSAKL
jgi:hypothetical protein